MGTRRRGQPPAPRQGSQGDAVRLLREGRGAAGLARGPAAAPPPAACLPACDGAPCSYRPIVDYIDAQFENYLQEELKIRRSLFDYHDTRIHVCLYFITPTGHSLKSLDLVTMKKLDSKVWCPPAGPVGSRSSTEVG